MQARAFALSLAVGAAFAGCDTPQKTSAQPDAATVSPPALSGTPLPSSSGVEPSPSARTEAVSTSITVGLAIDPAGADAGANKPMLSLRSRELDLDLPIRTLEFPNVCRSTIQKAGAGLRVSCTSSYRGWVAKALLEDGALNVITLDEKHQGRNVSRPVPAGKSVRFLEQEVSSRSLPGGACPETPAERKSVDLEFIANTISLPERRTSELLLRVVGGKGVVTLIDELGWWAGCKAHQLGDDVEIRCKNDKHFASVRGEGASVLIEWREKNSAPLFGRLLLPCGAQPKIKVPKNFSGYSAYR